MSKQSVGWRSSVGCDSFRDETYGDIITSGIMYEDISYGDKT
jgi:hypothetical protein